jgi:hypothetical protein
VRGPYNHEIYHFDNLRHSGTWTWHDTAGHVLAVTARFEGPDGTKEILPFSPWIHPERHTGIEWLNRAPPLNDLWYDAHLDDTISPILIVEGEKCAEAAKRMIKRPSALFHGDIPWVTTVLGGSRKVGRMNLDRLVGRHVIIMQDMDAAGLIHAGSFLRSNASSITLLRMPKFDESLDAVPVGYDIADMEEDNRTIEMLEAAASRKFLNLTLR